MSPPPCRSNGRPPLGSWHSHTVTRRRSIPGNRGSRGRKEFSSSTECRSQRPPLVKQRPPPASGLDLLCRGENRPSFLNTFLIDLLYLVDQNSHLTIVLLRVRTGSLLRNEAALTIAQVGLLEEEGSSATSATKSGDLDIATMLSAAPAHSGRRLFTALSL